MKKIILSFIFSFYFILAFNQIKLFENKIPQENINTIKKIHKNTERLYKLTNYFAQNYFTLNQKLTIQLPTARLIVVSPIKNYNYSNNTKSIVYSIENEPNSELVFSEKNEIIHGLYLSENGEKIEFQQTQPGIFAISIVDENYLTSRDKNNCIEWNDKKGKDISIRAPMKINNNICNNTTPICDNSTIDILTLYTTEAKIEWGGVNQSDAALATAITNFNTALVNSGVSNLTINLVYSGETTYIESGDLQIDLPRFSNEGDSFLDEVHKLRIIYGADLCSLIVATPTTLCGRAYINTDPTNYTIDRGFSTVVRGCVVSNYSYSHEIGHNMGLRHDWYIDTNINSPCSHQKGYINQTAINKGTNSTISQRWRTIMAFNDGCVNVGISCTRINRWSNPYMNYNSEPTGTLNTDTYPANEVFGFLRFGCIISEFLPTTNLTTLEVSQSTNNIKIYPNPVENILYISMPKGYSYQIFNYAGQMILSDTVNSISLKNINSGVYFINIYDANNQFVLCTKIIKK